MNARDVLRFLVGHYPSRQVRRRQARRLTRVLGRDRHAIGAESLETRSMLSATVGSMDASPNTVVNEPAAFLSTATTPQTITITWAWNENRTITNFNPATDKLALDWFSGSVLQLKEEAGSAVLAIPSMQQSYRLAGVPLASLTQANFTCKDVSATAYIASVLAAPPPPSTPPTPTPPPVIPPVSLGGMVTFVVTTDWGSGFNGDVAVKNTGTSLLSDWRVSFDFNGEISNLWNGEIVSRQGSTYIVKGAFWNAAVASGASTSFGFTAGPGGANAVLRNLVLVGVTSTPLPEPPPPTPVPHPQPDPNPTPPPVDPVTPPPPRVGRVFQVNAAEPDIIGFNPAIDRFDFGNVSVHNLIVGKLATGELAFVNPWAWTPEYQVVQGISFKDLTVENFGIVQNEHLRQDIGGALSWERGVGPRDPGTIYVRSHEHGVREVVRGFDPATQKLSFLYFGTRERLTVTDTAEGLLISVEPSKQSVLLVGVKKADLVPANIQFHHDQIIEDQLEGPFGIAAAQATLVSRMGLLTPQGPAGQSTDGHQTSPGSTQPGHGEYVPPGHDHDDHDHGGVDPLPTQNPDPTPTPTPTPIPTPDPGAVLPIAAHDKVLAAYFPEWGIYGRNFQVADVPAEKLTHLIYSFLDLTPSGQVALFDSYAATEKRFAAHETVSGEADQWYYPPSDPRAQQTVWGNFNQLAQLKEKYPHLTVSIAVGGWTLSKNFSTVTSTAAGREAFADSLAMFLDMYRMFDGIDFDWEYPGGGGLDGNSSSPNDGANYAQLVRLVRQKLDALGGQLGRTYEISVASPAGLEKIADFNLAGLAPHVDFFNVMTYDFHGTWEGTTGHQSAFTGDPAGYDIKTAVKAYLDAGVDSKKIVLGAPLYTRAWSGVVDGGDGGYGEAASGAAPGSFEPGNYDYKDLLQQVQDPSSGWKIYWDDTAQASYVYNASQRIFSSFETPTSIALKSQWADDVGLGGMMFWDISNDAVTSRESLVGAAYASWVLDADLASIRANSNLTHEIIVGGNGRIELLPIVL